MAGVAIFWHKHIFSNCRIFLIILGLAVAHLLDGVSHILDRRFRKKLSLIPFWTFCMLFTVFFVCLNRFILSPLELLNGIHF